MTIKRAKLGMTVEGKKKTPYDNLSERLNQGTKEQGRLERQGQRLRGDAAAADRRSQGKIPKAIPSFKKRGTRA